MFPLLLAILGLEIGGMKMVKPTVAPETLHYSVNIASGEKGFSDYIVSPESFNKKKAIKLLNISTFGKDTSMIYDTVILFIDAKTLSPLFLKRTIRGKFNALITGEYQKGKVKIHLVTNRGEKNFDLDRPKEGVDNEEIVYLLRWLDKKGPKKGTIVDITPMGGRSIDVNWEYLGDTTVTINKKKISAYKVKLNFLGRGVDIFYEKDAPRRMLEYIDSSSGTKMTLKLH